jgi:chromosome partitioning protein
LDLPRRWRYHLIPPPRGLPVRASSSPRQSHLMAHILAVSNQKGGVGKTTTTVNLAAALARFGQRVLVVDLDPQGNASSGLGYGRADVSMGLYDVIMGFRDMESVLLPTAIDNLQLVPATADLAGAEVELVRDDRREHKLRKALNQVRDAYDWVLIDCPPSLGLLTVNGLTASDGVLIPLQAEYYAMEGLGDLVRTILAVQKGLNPDLRREGIVLTMVDQRNNLCREVERQTREIFGAEVYESTIPRNVRLGEAPSYGKSIVEYAPTSKGGVAYLALASELLRRHGISHPPLALEPT